MKTLRVCLSSELPESLERSPDYLYFTYDNLYLYSGQNQLSDNYVIASAIPEDQVYGLIYILDTDGSVHRKVDYTDTTIAEIEDSSQIELLKKAGTMFYVNAGHRYMDSQRRTLTLPYNDGNYELTVAAKNDAVFDNNTILKYNTDSERFELYGESSEEFIDFSKPFRGATTTTAKVTVDGPRISADVLVSKSINNALKKASDGLYVRIDDTIDKDEFTEWTKEVSDLKKYAQDVLDAIDSEIKAMEIVVSPEAVQAEVYSILSEKFGDIQTALDNYQQYVDNLNSIENRVTSYASTTVSAAKTTIENTVKTNSSWNELDSSHEEYSHEINYYAKAEAYYYSEMTTRVKKLVIGAVVDAIMREAKDTKTKELILAAAVNKFIEDEENS